MIFAECRRTGYWRKAATTADIFDLDPRDRDKSNVDKIVDRTRMVAAQCQRSIGELGRYIVTDQRSRLVRTPVPRGLRADDIVEKFVVDKVVPQRAVSCPGTPDAAPSTGAQAKGMTAEADFSRLFTPFWP